MKVREKGTRNGKKGTSERKGRLMLWSRETKRREGKKNVVYHLKIEPVTVDCRFWAVKDGGWMERGE